MKKFKISSSDHSSFKKLRSTTVLDYMEMKGEKIRECMILTEGVTRT